jgi:Ca2+-binding RTX toxin-like protein
MATRKWGNEKIVNTSLAGDQYFSSVAGLIGGGFVVVWQDSNPTDDVILAQRYDDSGNKIGGVIAVSALNSQSGRQFEPSVTALADGGFYVGWSDEDASTDRDIVGAVFNANGGFVRDQNPDETFKNSSESSVARLGSGSVAVWTDETNGVDDINVKIYDAAGVAGNVFVANTVTASFQNKPSVAASTDGSKFAVLWTSSADLSSINTISGRIFTSTGTESISEFQITSTSGGYPTTKVVWLSNETFAVVWDETLTGLVRGSQIKMQIFDSFARAANPLTGIITVNSTIVEAQKLPDVTVLPNGGFVVAWIDDSGIGSDLDPAIKLQAFDGSGGKIGGELLVNTTTALTQTLPTISALADGRVVVTWTDESSGNSDIRMQIVDPRDGIVDGTSGADQLYGHDAVGDIITSGDGADTVYGLAGADVIDTGRGADIIYDGRGDDTVTAGADGDIIRGDLGDDQFFGGDGNDSIYSFGGADLMDGGAGTGDSVFYVNERSAVTINLVDQILNAGAAFGDTIANIERIYGVVYFANNLTGDANSNILVGGIKADVLNGGGNFDLLRGGLGADTMTGGTSGDYFQYTTATEGGDTITAWESGDKFTFARAAFGNLAGANVAAANFRSVASGHAASTTSQKFIFDQATDQLWYDADGSGAGAAIFIADITTNYNLLNTDLLLA